MVNLFCLKSRVFIPCACSLMTDYSLIQSFILSCVYAFYVRYHDFAFSNSKIFCNADCLDQLENSENRFILTSIISRWIRDGLLAD